MKIRPAYITALKIALVLSMLVLLWQYVRVTSFAEVWPAVQKAGPGLGYVLITTFTAYWIGTWSWWYCLGDARASISKWQLFTIRHVCETVGLFNPASFAGADMLKVMVLKPYGIGREAAITSVVISRILMIASQLVLVMIAVSWLIVSKDLGIGFSERMWILGLALLLLAVAGFVFYKFAAPVDLVTDNLELAPEKNWFGRIRAKIRAVRRELFLFSRHHKKDLSMAFLLATLHWIIGSIEFYILLKLLGYNILMIDSLLVDMGVILVKSAGAFIPGQLGVEEVGNRMMLGLIGIGSASLWLTVSVLRRSRQLFWILAGAVFYLVFIRTR